ncbi:helix-turn-helix transcriptional regulator [Acinetobacter baumannii]|uniref:MarR family transcriptional regulator n=1 Tax=Acinetobacter baumannii TaxID=470 RepID=UPI0007C1FDA8|nr:helix-turn-helix domain-containing protein [Acinetobacter baumannii]MBP4214672.1 helix-turn-helix domain-containing protein [Acinetobacter baumannii]MBP4247761.1 helix-turn-helix domain-containing protein [Acinetobacter baumannii]MBP4273924.1 helix-turn-helix domain-containing protein [Acinetobacter baumannii]MBP4292137.1 helix-turn-helix domain-containing protein [Acinetobacter baumannii]MBP4376898.1 helix-turn-helix domain-containing protein [Acinetobacter baumannii]
MCMNIQDKVIYLSNSRGLTQQQISERTGISQSSVSKTASGEQKEVAYNKGVALDALVASEQKREYEESKTKQLNRSA